MKKSNFLITINSNEQMDISKQHWFKQSIKYNFQDNLLNYIDYNTVYSKHTDPIKNHLKNIDINVGYETGEKFHKYHAHVNLFIEHDTYLKFNHQKLRSFYNNMLGHNIHINVKIQRTNQSEKIKDYVAKNGDVHSFSVKF